MQPLNLPSYEAKLQHDAGKTRIFDVIRKKYVVCTPEEWVRQHVIHFLINHLAYPKSLFRVESGVSSSTRLQRSDIVVHGRDGRPWLLVECKSPTEPIGTQVFHQSLIYNRTLSADFVAVTNGLQHYCFRPKPDGTPDFLTGFPAFREGG